MNILLLASHAVAEYDDLRMFTDLGYDTFAPGGYEDPSRSGEGIRPALPNAPHHPELVARLQEVRAERGEPGPAIDWGKAALHDDIIDWADTIIVHHFPEQWIGGQWGRIKHKRVIWRTCGQSDPRLEAAMSAYAREGMQIVRYSPAEKRFFTQGASRTHPLMAFAGEDALIRFGKYPDDYGPWVGDDLAVGNVTQDMRQRGESTGLSFYLAATEGLPARPAGPGSEQLPGGAGPLSYDEMREYLRRCRAYLYTGTRPASYTLGLIEAMLSGVPVVSIGATTWGAEWNGRDLFEADFYSDLAMREAGLQGYGILPWDMAFDDPKAAGRKLRDLLEYDQMAAAIGRGARKRAIDMFSVDTIGPQWQAFLS